MTLGALVGYLLYLGMFYKPIGQLHGLNQMLQSGRAAGERVLDILDATEERADGKRRENLRLPVRGEVIYENVSFSYDATPHPSLSPSEGERVAEGRVRGTPTAPDARPVLTNISLHAQPGEMIALVGPTGAGKSTMVNLLPAFYESSRGRILIDGQDIGTLTLASLRESISVVSQEPFLFNGTIRENILYGKLDATEEELISASQRGELP